MPSLNYFRINEYAQKYAKNRCEAFFHQHQRITGSQIVAFCPDQQVNFFVIKLLFVRWQEENAKLKSPYFDYESPAVKKALNDFLNLLSKNISVGREAFEYLLVEAVEETLLWYLSPMDFFQRIIGNHEEVKLGELVALQAKYIRKQKDFFDKISQQLHRNLPEIAPTSRILAQVQAFYEQNPHLNTQALLQDLHVDLPLQAQDFLLKDEPLIFEGDGLPNTNFEISELHFGLDDILEQSTPPQQPQIPQTQAQEQPKNETTLLKNNEATSPTAYQPTSQKLSESIRDLIPLNLKYAFIKELFNDSTDEFDKAIEIIDQCVDYHKAIMIIKEKYFRRYAWDLEKEEVKEFYEILSRKFY